MKRTLLAIAATLLVASSAHAQPGGWGPGMMLKLSGAFKMISSTGLIKGNPLLKRANSTPFDSFITNWPTSFNFLINNARRLFLRAIFSMSRNPTFASALSLSLN